MSVNKFEPELAHKLDLLGLYRWFVESKYDICYKEKDKTAAGNADAKQQRERFLKCMEKQHQLLDLLALFTADMLSFQQMVIILHC